MGDNTADSIINAVVKFAWPLFGTVALVTGTVLFLPSAATVFRLDRTPDWIQGYAGLAFIVSVAILICLAIGGVYKAFSIRAARARFEQELIESLHNLNNAEKAILREFILFGADVQNLPFQDSSVLALKNKGVIFLAARSAVVYGYEMEFPHQLPIGIKKMIEPDMIDLPKALRLYDSNREMFEAFRPHFRQKRRGYY